MFFCQSNFYRCGYILHEDVELEILFSKDLNGTYSTKTRENTSLGRGSETDQATGHMKDGG
jgi:hypothetical protein